MKFCKLICPLCLVLDFSTRAGAAHEQGAPFSDAIADPLVLHHAHIENEERINLFMLNRVQEAEVPGRQGYVAELELAYALPNHRYGFEVFIPIINLPARQGQGRVTGLADVLLRPLKLALFMQPDLVIATATEVRLPTGSQRDGNGNFALEQMLFADIAQGNWNVGINLGVGNEFDQSHSVPVEYGGLLGYSFISGTEFTEIAHVDYSQTWVPTLSVELVGEHALNRASTERDLLALVPGVALWHVHTGWQFRLGIEASVVGRPEAASTVLLQVGNHLKWL